MGLKEDLVPLAKQKLSAVLGDKEYEDLDRLLRQKETSLKAMDKELFAKEYLAVKLSLAAHVWEHQCAENEIKEEDLKKIFFRSVMQIFQEPKMVHLATAFSEYYYAVEPGPETPASVTLGTRLFERLGAQAQPAEKQTSGTGGCGILIETLEGFRVSMENELHDFFLARLS